MPASLAVLASVEVDYVTLPGWTEPLAACKACAFVSLLMPLPVFFSLGAPDVRGTPQERSGLREVVNFAANGCHTLHARCSSCLNILTSISSFAHRNLHHQSPSSVSRSFTPRLPRATATALPQVCSPTMPRLILRALAVFMLPDAHSWRGLLPPLSCLPCTAAVDAFQRAALCAGHCVLSAIIAANEHAASVRKSRLRCFRRLPCCLPAAAALTRTLRRSILDPQPQLPRAIAGRSCFAVRFCHVRRKACVAAPSMTYPAQQRVANCVDDCLRMNTS